MMYELSWTDNFYRCETFEGDTAAKAAQAGAKALSASAQLMDPQSPLRPTGIKVRRLSQEEENQLVEERNREQLQREAHERWLRGEP